MSDFDSAVTGPCETCGQSGRLVVDPYDLDVNNTTRLVYLCDEHEQAAADDI